ncbi:hypothetical protein MLD38_013051 [Melastoma candidum]|uniref:Uncharacterized protein n=1 Tax=Melastoma candidum TaxID=119954 RepID=A0ACB9R7Y1_9MYRT|nr:hypothetical protein MLD38_013051 [Melastoma candidum]
MDEFGVLTEQYGLKPQGKSAPMAASKPSVTSSSSFPSSSVPNFSWDFPAAGIANPGHASAFDDSNVFGTSGSRSGIGNNAQRSVNLDDFGDVFGRDGMSKSSAKSSRNGSNLDGFDYDGFFDSGSKHKSGFGANNDVGDDIFGGISSLSSSGHKGHAAGRDDEDIFGAFKSKPSVPKSDVLGSSFIPPPPRSGSQVGDLLGGFGSSNSSGFSGSNGSGSVKRMTGNNVGLGDDLIPGFGGSNSGSVGSGSRNQSQRLDSDDPFVILESASKPVHSAADPLDEFDQFTEFKSAKHNLPKATSPNVSSIDELEEFAKGALSSNKEKAGDDLESFYMKSRASSAPKSRPRNVVNSQDIPKVPQKPTHGVSASMKKASSATNMFNDLSAMFGGGPSEDFEEIEGETEERRIARLRRHERTQNRVAQAVAQMNQRDYQTQQEQEERYRISENINLEIKQWASGKEGNMRALLSSLQKVLWHECGWEAVSLTDLITSTSVKKVYRKAALCVHPDKVQQKGATVEQKYTAEKVFDILQEAWKKFETEELK